MHRDVFVLGMSQIGLILKDLVQFKGPVHWISLYLPFKSHSIKSYLISIPSHPIPNFKSHSNPKSHFKSHPKSQIPISNLNYITKKINYFFLQKSNLNYTKSKKGNFCFQPIQKFVLHKN